MDARGESEPSPMKNRTTVERKSERELVVTRTFNGPARIVFEAWTKPELLKRWWAPKSMGVSLLSCEAEFVSGARAWDRHEVVVSAIVPYGLSRSTVTGASLSRKGNVPSCPASLSP